MGQFVTDSFTDVAGTLLISHTGEVGATWTKNVAASDGGNHAVISNEGRLYCDNTADVQAMYASGVPPTANYSVFATFFVKSVIDQSVGICGRMNTGSADYYSVIYTSTSGTWSLAKVLSGSFSGIGSNWVQTIPTGQSVLAELRMIGTALSVYINGVLRISATDSSILTAGRASLRVGNSSASAAATNTTGAHLDNFAATDVFVASGSSAHVVTSLGTSW